jgi:hypothetical protein
VPGGLQAPLQCGRGCPVRGEDSSGVPRALVPPNTIIFTISQELKLILLLQRLLDALPSAERHLMLDGSHVRRPSQSEDRLIPQLRQIPLCRFMRMVTLSGAWSTRRPETRRYVTQITGGASVWLRLTCIPSHGSLPPSQA